MVRSKLSAAVALRTVDWVLKSFSGLNSRRVVRVTSLASYLETLVNKPIEPKP
jgi:hypothetical protein